MTVTKAAPEDTTAEHAPTDALPDFDLDDTIRRANKRELRGIIRAYRFLLLARGGTESDFRLAEETALRVAR